VYHAIVRRKVKKHFAGFAAVAANTIVRPGSKANAGELRCRITAWK
jgi:hypothetical protein